MGTITVGVVGIGKIATDQHIPVLRRSAEFRLVAAASRHHRVDGIANFASLEDMLREAAPDAIAVCTPPQTHFDQARIALEAGKHVLLEKPPCRSTSELDILERLAAERGRTLFQTWHSRFAPAVETAAEILRRRRIDSVTITWKEDVRRWHPGQTWIWQAGGFGVFDPGINAISILTRILPDDIVVRAADLFVPANCDAPIAAELTLQGGGGTTIAATFDFRHTGTQTWDIALETNSGQVLLRDGGAALYVDGVALTLPDTGDGPHAEYAPLYRRFAELIRAGQSDVDARPFRLVADAFLLGRRIGVADFHE